MGLPAKRKSGSLPARIYAYSAKKHRFIVGILLATSVLLVIALADYMMQHNFDQEDVVTQDSHYV